MAKRKDDITIEDLENVNESNETVTEIEKSEVEKETKETKTEGVGIPAHQMMWFESNKEIEFLYFDNVGGVFVSEDPASILEKCNKVKNPLYGNK